MTKEIKAGPKVNHNNSAPNESNTRAIVVVGVFILIFIALIAYEVISRK